MLNLSRYLIKEEVGFLKLTDKYVIFDPNTETQIGYAKENISPIIKALRLFVNKQLLPTKIDIINSKEELQFYIKKAPMFIRAKVDIIDSAGKPIGYFKSKFFSIGGKFDVYDISDNKVAEVRGDWKGWNFKFIGSNENEIGTVNKKWAGIGKELFTSADTYMITIKNTAVNATIAVLLLAAGLAVDIVYKEKK